MTRPVSVEKISDRMDLSRREAPSIFWLRWWRTCTDADPHRSTPCSACHCSHTARLGVPVVRTDSVPGRRGCYIVPLCRTCARVKAPLEVHATDMLPL